ncbi:Response regulator receiver domain-containing protein [Saccharicrinis carchari]|uniref:Response regulator receiver domain-containing protein n=1 Tax=Saccharicrinis carchari TaxID=1168039 RepID=A0A521CGN1_SACCC|nr:response regulator [Saccharicrinis carchari]SMO58593.1 Response regulator receiver domain-containing protein [Saccharicrinis carchari]
MKNSDALVILLVEDNILNQRLINLHLKKFGYNIEIANNGKEAVEMAKEKRYDLIIMDLMMPVMDGLEATREIRKYEENMNYSTPIIGLTANTFDGDRDKCLSHGMDEYMTKPFELDLFIYLLKKMGITQ